MSTSTAWEKFQAATLSLVRSGAIKDRITDAYRNHLSRIDEAELPNELLDDFRILNDAMTREAPAVRGDDAFRATLRKMSNGEAEEVATWVVKLFCALPRERVPAVAATYRERTSSGAQIVPLARVAER
jgi:hypothetical protein